MNEQKHLGLILDSSLSFKKHINEKIIKAQKNLGIIKHLSMFLPIKTLDQMYKARVRSLRPFLLFIYCVFCINLYIFVSFKLNYLCCKFLELPLNLA